MKSHFITGASLLLAAPLVSATCTTFTQSGDPYYYADHTQSQIVTAGVICTTNSTTYGNCVQGTSGTNDTRTGCTVFGSGLVHANGLTNLSSVSAADTAPLWPLVGAQANFTNYEDVRYGFNQSWSGCFSTVYQRQTCIFPGNSGYVDAYPALTCVNGTLSGCSGGSIVDGTGVSICGVSVLDVEFGGGYAETPLMSTEFVITTAGVADTMVSNPSQNSTCTALAVTKSGAVALASRSIASVLMVSGMVMVWFMGFF